MHPFNTKILTEKASQLRIKVEQAFDTHYTLARHKYVNFGIMHNYMHMAKQNLINNPFAQWDVNTV